MFDKLRIFSALYSQEQKVIVI